MVFDRRDLDGDVVTAFLLADVIQCGDCMFRDHLVRLVGLGDHLGCALRYPSFIKVDALLANLLRF